jgi:hypothetical protein
MKKVPLILETIPAAAPFKTFATTSSLLAAIPDGAGFCSQGSALNLIVSVASASAAVSSVVLGFTMAPNHTWYGDVKCVVRSPSGASSVVMAPFCEGSTDDPSNPAGRYTLSDAGATLFDDAAVAAANTSSAGVPSGTYRPDESLNGLLLDQINTPTPLFSGNLGASGSSFLAIPGVAAGLTVQIVGVNITTAGIPVFSSTPVSFTVN